MIVSLANPKKLKKYCPIVKIPIRQIWQRETRLRKVWAILRFRYIPDSDLKHIIAKEIFEEELFGTEDDLGNSLFKLMIWHYNRDWELKELLEEDKEKADALEAMMLSTRQRYWKYTSPELNLRLMRKQPIIAPLVYPVVAKTPIRSIQYFVEVDASFAFNSIRKSRHTQSSDIISYLYELLILQQKTAIFLHSLVRLIDTSRREKKDSILIKSDIDAALNIDSIIVYLKSSIEKSILLIGYSFCVLNLENQKKHEQKIRKLFKGIPEDIKKHAYFEFIEEFLSSKRIQELNNFRTGIVHKKGSAKTQPHSYVQNAESYKMVTEVFRFLMEQHSKNSTILIASLALLTDELVMS